LRADREALLESTSIAAPAVLLLLLLLLLLVLAVAVVECGVGSGLPVYLAAAILTADDGRASPPAAELEDNTSADMSDDAGAAIRPDTAGGSAIIGIDDASTDDPVVVDDGETSLNTHSCGCTATSTGMRCAIPNAIISPEYSWTGP